MDRAVADAEYLKRVIEIINMIPLRAGSSQARISINGEVEGKQGLIQQLEDKGLLSTSAHIGTKRKNVLRILNSLQESYGQQLGMESEGRTNYYFWNASPIKLGLAHMEYSQAIAFTFLHRYLEKVFSKKQLRQLEPYISVARESLLATGDEHKDKRWLKKVAIQGAWPPVVAPKIKDVIFDEVQVATYEGKWLDVVTKENRQYRLEPLGIVKNGGRWYLYAKIQNAKHADLNTFALDRLRSAKIVDLPVQSPTPFDINAAINKQELAGQYAGKIQLKLRLNAESQFIFEEQPLSEDQKITADTNPDFVLVSAGVDDTKRLRLYLIGLVDSGLEIIEPAYMRDEMARLGRQLSARHRRLSIKTD